MDTGPKPDVELLARELKRLLASRTATLRLVRDMPSAAALHVIGGPNSPRNQTEATERVNALWRLLRQLMKDELREEIADDAIVNGETSAEACVEAAQHVFREAKRGDEWRCSEAADRRGLDLLRKDADELLRPNESRPNRKSFEEKYEMPILRALARLLLKAEAEHHGGSDAAPNEKSTEKPLGAANGGGKGGVGKRASRRVAPRLVAATSILLFAALVFAVARNGDSGAEAVLAPGDLSVWFGAGLEDQPESPTSRDPTVDVDTADGVQELGFHVLVRPSRGQHGRIPPGLHLVVVIPRKSLTTKSLPLAFLRAGGSAVREVGQQASDAVTIASQQTDSLGLDVPSSFRVQVRRANEGWAPPQLLASRWLTCTRQRCELRLPLARFAGDDGDAVRVRFQALAFGLAKNAPLLVVDMEQRRLMDRLARDTALHVSPGDRVLYSLYLANRGTEPAHNVVARLALPSGARLIPGSIRATTTGASTPSAVEGNLVDGGVRYSIFGPEASARFTALVSIRPSVPTAGEMYPYWLVESDETHGTRYYDSVTTSVGG
jgi:uncharacterized repeat protein (TIGR01451 family)